MPAGKDLMTRVASYLHPDNGKTVAQIRDILTVGCTPRAVRYAVTELLKDGRATRKGRLIFAGTDLVVDVLDGASGPQSAVPLRSCFPDDLDGYADAKGDLLHHGEHQGGGGAAATYSLKLHEVA
jgi:hypothetical protein